MWTCSGKPIVEKVDSHDEKRCAVLFLTVLFAFAGLGWLAGRFGVDSRDGRDWQSRDDRSRWSEANYR
jgi:hypothetical protein